MRNSRRDAIDARVAALTKRDDNKSVDEPTKNKECVLPLQCASPGRVFTRDTEVREGAVYRSKGEERQLGETLQTLSQTRERESKIVRERERCVALLLDSDWSRTPCNPNVHRSFLSFLVFSLSHFSFPSFFLQRFMKLVTQQASRLSVAYNNARKRGWERQAKVRTAISSSGPRFVGRPPFPSHRHLASLLFVSMSQCLVRHSPVTVSKPVCSSFQCLNVSSSLHVCG